jgi:hypothetical protein
LAACQHTILREVREPGIDYRIEVWRKDQHV